MESPIALDGVSHQPAQNIILKRVSLPSAQTMSLGAGLKHDRFMLAFGTGSEFLTDYLATKFHDYRLTKPLNLEVPSYCIVSIPLMRTGV